MLILIANAMFQATRTAPLSLEPVRKGWIRSIAGNCNVLTRFRTQARKPDTTRDS